MGFAQAITINRSRVHAVSVCAIYIAVDSTRLYLGERIHEYEHPSVQHQYKAIGTRVQTEIFFGRHGKPILVQG